MDNLRLDEIIDAFREQPGPINESAELGRQIMKFLNNKRSVLWDEFDKEFGRLGADVLGVTMVGLRDRGCIGYDDSRVWIT